MLVPPSFIHQDARRLEVLCLALSCSLLQISFQTEPIEPWNCILNHNELVFLQQEKKKGGKMARVNLYHDKQIERKGMEVSKCYLTITAEQHAQTWLWKTGSLWLALVVRVSHRQSALTMFILMCSCVLHILTVKEINVHADKTNGHFDIQNLKQVLDLKRNFQRQVKLIELVIPTIVTLPQEGLLMWDSHYLMGNFMLISWTDQSVLSCYASLDKLQDSLPYIWCTCFFFWDAEKCYISHLQPQVPFGNNFRHCGDFNSVLTRPITVWQTLVRVYRGIQLIMKEASKIWREKKSLNSFWLPQLDYMKIDTNVSHWGHTCCRNNGQV